MGYWGREAHVLFLMSTERARMGGSEPQIMMGLDDFKGSDSLCMCRPSTVTMTRLR